MKNFIKLNEDYEAPEEPKDKKETPKSEWDLYEAQGGDPVLLSDYEHKAFLINSKINDINDSGDVIPKDLSLSRIDNELALIYSNKLGCIEEWANLGFKKLAKRRLVHLIGKLKINMSVGGFERILQTAIANAGVELTEKGMKLNNEKEKNPLIELANQFNQRM